MRTYGLYAIQGDDIGVELEPVAAVRFKRIFERVRKEASECILLSATPENARELEWFMGRYPLSPQQGSDEKRLDELARAFDHQLELISALSAPDYVPPSVSLALPPRPYQLLPAAMLAVTSGVLVGDDVGLGKTVESFVALAQDGALPALIVTLTHLPRQWQRELQRFLPGVSSYVLQHGSPAHYVKDKGQRLRCIARLFEKGHPLPDVIITSYSKIAGWSEWINTHLKPKTVIWDEVQEFRNGMSTDRGRSGKSIADRAERRMGLSATPIHNEGSEIYNVMEFVAPYQLGKHEEFMREWCGLGGNVKEPRLLGSYLRERGLFIRRTREEVGRELPPLTIAEQFCECDPKALDLLNHSERAVQLAQLVLSGTRQAFHASGEFDMLMRQRTGVAKAPYVAAFVDMMLQSGEPVILYGWHRECYNLWKSLLAQYEPAFYTGKEDAKEKDEAVRRFREGETKLFIISLRSGAGIDGLQFSGCSNVVFGELDWSQAVHEQAMGRLHRDGIESPITAWFLVSDEGSDPFIAERLGVKRGQLEGIRDPEGGIVSGQIDDDAVKRLAEDFLKRRGVAVPIAPKVEPLRPIEREVSLFAEVSA